MGSNSEIVIYKNPDGNIKIDVRLEDETVWLSQSHLCKLFDKNKRTISEHIRNIFAEGELQEESVVRKFRTTALSPSKKHRCGNLIIRREINAR